MRMVGGDLTAFGVVNGGIGTRQLICDHGAVYESFGPDVSRSCETQ